MKAFSVPIYQPKEGADLTAGMLKQLLEIVHDDTPIKVKIGDTYYPIREYRQVTDLSVSPHVLKVLVPADVTITTK